MRAVVHDRYGDPDVLRVDEVERPAPRDGEVLVEVHAASVNRTDCGFRAAKPFITRFFSGLRAPKKRVLGTEFAGTIAAVGPGVTELDLGDRVFGVNADGFGAHAEYLRMRQSAPITTMPTGMSFEEGAAVCDGGILALTCLRWPKVGAGQRIMIYGASGSIGTAAVQLAAHHFGAHVTAVCTTKNVELVRSLGAADVIDYTTDDFTAIGQTYDVVFDAVGKLSYGKVRHLLTPKGLYVSTDLGRFWQNPLLALATKFSPRHRVMMPLPRYRKEEVLLLKGLIEKGEYRAVIDRCYPLDEIVDATQYVETEQKTGNVVITVR